MPSQAPASEGFADLPRLPRDAGGPVFAEPWQAQAFALAVKLSEQGHFTWKEWASALANELQAAARRGEPDDGSRYYEHWLAALEALVTAKGLTDRAALAARKDAWAAAYQHTPHGQAVELLHSRGPEASWLLLGLGVTFSAFWLLQQASLAELGPWAAGIPAHDGAEGARSGFAASAGFGLLLGMRHALEPDHLAAVSTLMTGERSSGNAAWLGACWGLGHTLTLLASATLLVLLRAEMPAFAESVFELGVVLLLVGFGVRAIVLGARRASAAPAHRHGNPGTTATFYLDRWTIARPLLVGGVHGLAGSGALIALVATTLPSTAAQLAYLALFGVGSTVGMAALSGIFGWSIARWGVHRAFTRSVALVVGGLSTALGLFLAYSFVAVLFQ